MMGYAIKIVMGCLSAVLCLTYELYERRSRRYLTETTELTEGRGRYRTAAEPGIFPSWTRMGSRLFSVSSVYSVRNILLGEFHSFLSIRGRSEVLMATSTFRLFMYTAAITNRQEQ